MNARVNFPTMSNYFLPTLIAVILIAAAPLLANSDSTCPPQGSDVCHVAESKDSSSTPQEHLGGVHLGSSVMTTFSAVGFESIAPMFELGLVKKGNILMIASFGAVTDSLGESFAAGAELGYTFDFGLFLSYGFVHDTNGAGVFMDSFRIGYLTPFGLNTSIRMGGLRLTDDVNLFYVGGGVGFSF